MKTITKNGHPLVFLPDNRQAARTTLRLYPAQTWKGRAFRSSVDWALTLGIPLPLREASAPQMDFSSICWVGGPSSLGSRVVLSHTGIFAGNPHAEGRRYLFAFCDTSGNPVCLAKAGFSTPARNKIDAERRFLRSASGQNGVPELLGEIESSDCSAILLPFLVGDTPSIRLDNPGILETLSGWISHERPILLGDIPAWQTIVAGCEGESDKLVRPVLGHGDFAPWNVIVDARGHWQVIDWERGCQCWVPGWDWFHYLVQVMLLVKKLPPLDIVSQARGLISSPAFQSYAAATGIGGIEWMLFRGYLLYAQNVLQQTEGADALARLVDAAAAA